MKAIFNGGRGEILFFPSLSFFSLPDVTEKRAKIVVRKHIEYRGTYLRSARNLRDYRSRFSSQDFQECLAASLQFHRNEARRLLDHRIHERRTVRSHHRYLLFTFRDISSLPRPRDLVRCAGIKGGARENNNEIKRNENNVQSITLFTHDAIYFPRPSICDYEGG